MAEDRTIAIDTLHMLTSFETFDDLKQKGRGLEQVIEIIEKLVRATVAVTSTV